MDMTVRELIEELENFDDDMEVVMKPSNSIYVDSIRGAIKKEMTAMYGEDREVLVILSYGQEGSV